MNDEIFDLVYDYSVNNKLADRKFIDRVIEIALEGKKLFEYVLSTLYTSNDNSNTFASYDALNKEILIHVENMKFLRQTHGYYDFLSSEFERVMLKNLRVVQVVLHEMEHASQCKSIDCDNNNSIENSLLKASFYLLLVIRNPQILEQFSNKERQAFFSLGSELRRQYYDFDPAERLAEINSLESIISIILPIKKEFPDLYEFEIFELIREHLRGYFDSYRKRGVCPTQLYLSAIGHNDVWTNFDFYNNDVKKLKKQVSDKYDLIERLRLGLPVSDAELSGNLFALAKSKIKYKKDC